MQKLLTIIFFFLLMTSSFAQRGKDGNIIVNNSNVVLNSYTYLTQNAVQGSNTINVASTSGFGVGDLILIIQMQGAMLRNLMNSGLYNETWGAVLSYQNCGLYEFQQINSVGSNQLVFDCGLKNNYDTVGKVQVIRVPRYNIFMIVNGANISCPAWDGQTGGIIAIESLSNSTINGLINVNGKGFRGGVKDNASVAVNIQILDVASMDSAYGGAKGEGVGGFGAWYDNFGGSYGRGAAANGGGGGNGHNSGGGGGANAGTGTWNGLGNPDNGNGNIYAQAWNLEYNGFSNNVSPGGGKGGYSFSTEDNDALITSPGDMAWGGNNRANIGGYGGRPLNYGINTERVYMGGGGGAGDGNDGASTDGARGGGIVFLISYAQITGSGNITANGSNGFVTPPFGNDAPGGGGGGGTIILNATGNISNISAFANGGQGGNQNISTGEAEGPGGGGSGGYIAKTNGAFTQQANGGANGVTNSASLSEFPPNGATKGGSGLTDQSITNFSVNTIGDSICSSNTATIYASLSGDFPTGTTLNWYLTASGGTPFYSGTAWTTPVLNTTTTYYVGSCPGTYRVPVTVFVRQAPSANAGNDTSVCIGHGVQLSASGGVSYMWLPATGLNSMTISNPIASPSINTLYTVTVTDIYGCTNTDNIDVVVNPLPQPGAGATSSSICFGNSTTIVGVGGVSYHWNTGDSTSTFTVSPSVPTTYVVTVTDINGCSAIAQVTLGVLPLPVANAGTDTSVCFGSGVQLIASGSVHYAWSPAVSLSAGNISNPIASPAITTTYTVTVSTNQGCSTSDAVVVTVNPLPQITGGGAQSICLGDSASFIVGGGVSYIWSNGETTPGIIVSPVLSSSYTVTVTDALGCVNKDTVLITVFPLPNASAGNDTSICPGTNAQLHASGGVSYSWNPSIWLNNNTIANPIAMPISNITYFVNVTDTNGCSKIDSININLYPEPIINIIPSVFSGCGPLQVFFNDSNLTNISNWEWNFGDPASDTNNISVLQNPAHTYNSAGTYSVELTLTTIHGCQNTYVSNNLITVYPNPVASFEAQPSTSNIYHPTIAFINNSIDAVSWTWNFGNLGQSTSTVFEPSFTYDDDGTYLVTLFVLSPHGCADSTSGEVVMKPEFTFFIPNVFTPDNDGLNDYFQGVGKNFNDYKMLIYDRWGKLIFETNDYAKPWYGKRNNTNEFCMAGVYVYIITVVDYKGKEHVYHGHVTLLK